MQIINPLYDTAFKYLMQNQKYAKKVLSVILDVDVFDAHLQQQETSFIDEKNRLSLFRLDFKATIRELDGTEKIVLIELQKSKSPTDILRFRNYLASAYMQSPEDQNEEKILVSDNELHYDGMYPLITIYILGYNLEDLPYMAVTVNNEVVNSVNKQKITTKSFFVEHLTHRSHIIQVRRLPDERQTRLEKFLMLFNQAWRTEKNYIIDLQSTPEGFEDIARYLQDPLLDEKFRRNLEGEYEYHLMMNVNELRYQKALTELNKEKELRQKEEDLRYIAMCKLALRMKKDGESLDEIKRETGLSDDEISQLQ